MGEDELRRLADLKLKVEERIRDLEDELELMREVARLIDEALRKGSFAKASQVAPGEVAKAEEEVTRALRRTRDGLLLANVRISKDAVVVDVNPELGLRSTTPPFKSYFVNRILNDMKAKDEEEGRKPLSYEIEEDGDKLRRIIIRNPGNEERVNELLNILTWTLSKMLEKMERSGGFAQE